MFLTAVSLAVAAIPRPAGGHHHRPGPGGPPHGAGEGPGAPARAVETLGSVTYICSDKTGTLTLNRMAVEEVWLEGETRPARVALPPGEARELFLRGLALCNDAALDGGGEAVGDPTETALLLYASGAGAAKGAEEARFPRLAELPFDSDRKCMTTFHALPAAGGLVHQGGGGGAARKRERRPVGRGGRAPRCRGPGLDG